MCRPRFSGRIAMVGFRRSLSLRIPWGSNGGFAKIGQSHTRIHVGFAVTEHGVSLSRDASTCYQLKTDRGPGSLNITTANPGLLRHVASQRLPFRPLENCVQTGEQITKNFRISGYFSPCNFLWIKDWVIIYFLTHFQISFLFLKNLKKLIY